MKGALELKDFANKIKEGAYILINLLTPEENLHYGIIEGTNVFYNINDPEVINEIHSLDKSKKYLLYCHTGVRSLGIYNSLKLAGIRDIYYLDGGIENWINNSYPIIKS